MIEFFIVAETEDISKYCASVLATDQDHALRGLNALDELSAIIFARLYASRAEFMNGKNHLAEINGCNRECLIRGEVAPKITPVNISVRYQKGGLNE